MLLGLPFMLLLFKCLFIFLLLFGDNFFLLSLSSSLMVSHLEVAFFYLTAIMVFAIVHLSTEHLVRPEHVTTSSVLLVLSRLFVLAFELNTRSVHYILLVIEVKFHFEWVLLRLRIHYLRFTIIRFFIAVLAWT
jgi:hypothetical protein